MGEFLKSYPAWLAQLQERLDGDAALRLAVGDSFVTCGKVEHALLRQLGLAEPSVVVDVGCGSGRLSSQLAPFPGIRYAGFDVVPQMLDYARRLSNRPDWDFCVTDGRAIPELDDSADFVCFFSVFTHLKHEETYRYLAEAKRILKPGGRIVFSFLEFRAPFHWMLFDLALRQPADAPLTQFIDRDAIQAFADHLDLKIDAIWQGGTPHIPIEEDVVWDDGRRQSGLADLGQSVAVLKKISGPAPASA